MLDNTDLFELSLRHREPFIDKYYQKKARNVITSSPEQLNDLMQANMAILDNLSAYKVALDTHNEQMQTAALDNIYHALDTTGINLAEFTNYWATKDISYSVYKNTLKTSQLKRNFLEAIVPEYLKDRHNLYRAHGYSFGTLQVVKDSKAHKGNGNAGLNKMRDMLEGKGFSFFTGSSIDSFCAFDRIYLFPDRGGSVIFKQILDKYQISFTWSGNHENKQTDCLFKLNGEIYIVEHKHMKESGGGQDKQMSEIINYISYTDHGVHYVSFLDGVYFNLLADETIQSGKPYEQKKSIRQNLLNNKNNYFVNTFGFQELIKQTR